MDKHSPKYVERQMEKKSNHKNFVHLVGLYTYCAKKKMWKLSRKIKVLQNLPANRENASGSKYYS